MTRKRISMLRVSKLFETDLSSTYLTLALNHQSNGHKTVMARASIRAHHKHKY